MRPRGTFRRRRQGGSRWGDAGRKFGVVRAERAWTGWYENPGCGELVEVLPTVNNECWQMEHNLVAPLGGQPATNANESTILAFRGTIELWVPFLGYTTAALQGAAIAASATGMGFGLQLVSRRTTVGGGVLDAPRDWEDCDNSDWLFRRWFPAQSTGPLSLNGTIGTQSGTWMLVGDEKSRELDVTVRKVDWQEWALYATWAQPATEDGVWLTRVNARLYEQFVGGQSVLD